MSVSKRRSTVTLCLCGFALMRPATATGQEVPPLPTDQPVWMVGSSNIDGRRLEPYDEVRFSIGGTDKDGPLAVGESVDAAAHQFMSLRAERRDGRDVWVRSFRTLRAGDTTVVASGEIVLDRRTLAPLSSSVQQGGSRNDFDYDWDTHEVRVIGSGGAPPESLDLTSLEAAAHETWVAAIDWREGLRVMIPTILAGGGGKWWAVPRVTGSEDVDLGDGVLRSSWVVEMDWWGMGPDHSTFTPGGGVNGSAGTGGKYWVLKEQTRGVPPVVRIQTEVAPAIDQVHQIQGGP